MTSLKIMSLKMTPWMKTTLWLLLATISFSRCKALMERMDMSNFSVMTMEQIEAVAAKHNCSVVVAKDNELQLDLDELGDMRKFVEFYEARLCKRFNKGILSYTEWTSKSGNRHVVVTLPVELPVVERIGIQAMAGSDPIREWAALNCHYAGSKHPILLFKPNY